MLGEQVAQRLLVVVILEKGFIGADHLGIGLQALAYTRAQLDDPLDAIGGQKAVAQNLLGLLADPVDAPGALDEPDDRPGQIVVHHTVRVL